MAADDDVTPAGYPNALQQQQRKEEQQQHQHQRLPGPFGH
jgi:hypothetical protein